MTTLPQTTGIRFNASRAMVTGAGMSVPAPHAGHAAAAAVGTQSGMSAGDVWRVLRANGWLIAGILVLSLIAGVGAHLLLSKYKTRYTSVGWLKISDSRPSDPLDKNRGNDMTDMTRITYSQRTQAALLRQEPTIIAAIQNGANIRQTQWFRQFIDKNGQPDIPAAKEDLLDRLTVSPQQDSFLISVAFDWRVPKDCRDIVNDVVNEHLSKQLAGQTSRDNQRSQELNQLKNQLTFRQQGLQDDLRRLQVELNKEGINVGQRVSSPKELELTALIKSMGETQDDFNQAQSMADAINAKLSKGEFAPQVQMYVEQDPQIQRYRAEVDSAEMSMAISESSVSNQSPVYKRMAAARDKANEMLENALIEKRASYTQQLKDQYEGRAEGLKKTLEGLTERVDKIKDQLADLDFKQIQYLSKLDDAKATAENLALINNQLATVNTNKNNQAIAGIEWAQAAEIPDTPSFPKFWWVMGVAAGMGLALSLGVAFVRELLDTSVRSPRDITRVGQLNLLGMIPHEDDDPQAAGVPLPMVIFQAPHSIIAEQFRQVRTRLQHAAALDTTRSILVTSPSPSDGKTIVAANLAAGLALNGRKILLVDANFRRPELHKIFKLENNAGFSSVLDSLDNFESAVSKTQVPNLDVLTAGSKPGNATELLESQLLIDFIDKALEEYDHVIFDSGPLLFISETVALAPRVDGVVTVVRASTNSRGLLQRLRDTLRQLKAEHLGVVLNGVRAQGGGYYGRNIKTYYEYQNGHAA